MSGTSSTAAPARVYQSTTTVTVTTPLGAVQVRFTDGRHAFVSVDAHINDHRPALVFRGQEYIGSCHVYLQADGTWSDVPPSADYGRSGHWSKRPQWTDAPRTHAAALTAACVRAVSEYAQAHPDAVARAEVMDASNDVIRWEDEERKALEVLAGVRAQLGAAHDRIMRSVRSAEVRSLAPGEHAEDPVTCGTCGRTWDDAVVTSCTPAPAGRCPFEQWH